MFPPQNTERNLEVLQKTYNELQRYYTLLRLIRADLEKITNNFIALDGEYNVIFD